jgi:hypothetical protein
VIKKIIKEENLLQNLSKLFTVNDYTVNFKQDWIGRIYAVVNPIAQDPNSRIFEYDEHGMNVKSFVEKWLIEHMIAADNFVKNHELFDILTYDIQQLDEDYNSKEFKGIIKLFKDIVPAIAKEKIDNLTKYLN